MPSRISLVHECSIRGPGKVPPGSDSVMVILRETPRVDCLIFIFTEPRTLPTNGVLRFTVDYSRVPEMEYDIVGGDACFPEIHITSVDGEIFRFKRGNFKDFFHLSEREQPQLISLPLASFIYNIDVRTNAPRSNDFMKKGMKNIAFHFLRPRQGEAEIIIERPEIVEQDDPDPSVFSYLDIMPSDRPTDSTTFTTNTRNLGLRISKTELGLRHLPAETAVHVSVAQNGSTFERSWTLGAGATYISADIPRLGGAEITITLLKGQSVVARSIVSAVRCIPATQRSSSKLGISESANCHAASLEGGSFVRRILPLSSIRKTPSGFVFDPSQDFLGSLRSINTDWFVSLKYMPKFLQQDRPDAYRCGPSELGLYREMMEWLVAELAGAGVTHLETWNEANVIHEWVGSFEEMVQMHCAVFDAARSTGSGIKILTPSTTTWDFDFINSVLESPIAEKAHGLAIHGYTYTPQRAQELFDRLESLISESSSPELPVHITEMGIRVPAFSNHMQAQWQALFSLHAHFRQRFHSIAWFRFRNTFPENLSGYDQNASSGYGMVGYLSRYSRPAQAAYRFLDRVLSGCEPVGIDTTSHGTVFRGRRDRAAVNFVYGLPDHMSLAMPFRYDVFGNTLSHSTYPELFCAMEQPVA
jgi:hypothetical protein